MDVVTHDNVFYSVETEIESLLSSSRIYLEARTSSYVSCNTTTNSIIIIIKNYAAPHLPR